jgi:ATP-binding cassette subfamily B protein
MRSETLHQLSRLLGHLPGRRLQALKALLPLSVLPGLIDLASVAVVARLTGALVGSGLEDRLPGVRVFGGNGIDQSLWLILIFIVLAWAASIAKLSLRFLQQRLSAQIWRDLSDQVHARLLNQPYEYHLGKSTADLSAQLLANMNRVASNVVTPTLQIISSSVSIVLLSLGILFVGRWLAVILVTGLVLAYWLISIFVTPRLRHGYQQKIRLEGQSMDVLFDSLNSIRDIQLAGSEAYFEREFNQLGQQAQVYSWVTEWLPDLPRALIEPLLTPSGGCSGFVVVAQQGSRSDSVRCPSQRRRAYFRPTVPVATLMGSAPGRDHNAESPLRSDWPRGDGGKPGAQRRAQRVFLCRLQPHLRQDRGVSGRSGRRQGHHWLHLPPGLCRQAGETAPHLDDDQGRPGD